MAARGPWSVKGIDAKAREAALEAARSEGVTLGDYLNRLLLEADRRETDMALPANTDPDAANDVRASAKAPDTDALEKLNRRIEAAEARATLSVTGIDQSVVGLLARINNAEKSQEAMEGRIEFASDELRQAQDLLQKRIDRVEADDTSEQNLRALKSLEHTLERLSNRVEETRHTSETKTNDFAGRLDQIDTRLSTVSKTVDDTLEDVASRVAKAVEDAELRSEGTSRHLADRVSRVEERVSSTLTKVSDSVERLTGTVSDSEERSVRAMDVVTRLDEDARNKLSDVDTSLADISDRLARAETSTDSALMGLESSFSRLDERLELFEEDLDGGRLSDFRDQFEARIQKVQDDMAMSVALTRQELASQIEQASAVPTDAFSEMNTAVSEMNKRLRRAEQRQTQAVEAIGEEVARLTETLDKRVQVVEQRNESELSGTIREQIEELAKVFHARISDLEAREDAPGLETMTGKMNDLANALTARVEASEEHSASAIREFTEHVTTLTKNLQSRQDENINRISSEIKASEARQNDAMSNAISGVNDRIEKVEEATSTSISPIQKAMSSLAERLQAVEDFANPAGARPYSAESMSFANFEDKLKRVENSGRPAETPEQEAAAAPSDFDKRGFPDEEELNEADTWAHEEDAFHVKGDFDEPSEDLPEEFGVDLPDDGYDLGSAEADPDEYEAETFGHDLPETEAGPNSGPDNYLSRARAAALAGQETSRSRKASAKKRASGGSSRLPIVAAASVLALTAVGTAGYMMMRGKQDAGLDYLDSRSGRGSVGDETLLIPGADGESIGENDMLSSSEVMSEDDAEAIENIEAAIIGDDIEPAAGTTDAPAETRNTEPLAQKPTARPAVSEPQTRNAEASPAAAPVERAQPTPTPTVSPVYNQAQPTAAPISAVAQPVQASRPTLPAGVSDYQSGVAMIDAGQISEGVDLVRRAADNGLPIAQYRMSKLYERGQGVPRDLAQSRSWTEKAAESGNVKAMHDLAVFYAEGDGGTQSYAGAVKWFRQAADYGLVDSQYNLGVLYEQGLGVTANPSEALYWFRVAERLGDGAAAAKVAALSSQIDPQMKQQTEQLAARYQPKVSEPLANGRFPDPSATSVPAPSAGAAPTQDAQVRQVREAQVLLTQMGYNPGVADGDFGGQTRSAIMTFQAANGLPQSGQVTPTLIRQLRYALNGE